MQDYMWEVTRKYTPKILAFQQFFTCMVKLQGGDIGWDNTNPVWSCILGKSAGDMTFTHCKAWGGGFHEP